VRYYNFDVQSTTRASVYVLYREGEDKPVPGQLDIIDTLPGEKGYNDFRQVWKVWVAKDYVANSIKDAAVLRKAGYKMQESATLRNMPVVPDKSRARLKGENAELQRAWYRGQVAKYFSFNEATLSAAGTNVPVSPIYVTFNVNPREPDGGPASGFRTELKSLQTHNVPSTLPGDAGYSPLWLVAVYDNANWPSVRDLDTVLKAKCWPLGRRQSIARSFSSGLRLTEDLSAPREMAHLQEALPRRSSVIDQKASSRADRISSSFVDSGRSAPLAAALANSSTLVHTSDSSQAARLNMRLYVGKLAFQALTLRSKSRCRRCLGIARQ
jgi:hypothetical protein